MKNSIKASMIVTAFLLLTAPPAQAHQPRLAEGPVRVEMPEVSKAYYGELTGQPAEFRIEAPDGFKLYLGLLVPDISGARTDMSLFATKDGAPAVVLDGKTAEWKEFHEEFANDRYLSGPEYSAEADAGIYVIRVHNGDNRGKFVLAVGEKEEFTPAETLSALRIIPALKRDFFGKSPADFALSIMGGTSLVLMVLCGALLGLLYRSVSRRLFKSKPRLLRHNIGRSGRLGRAILAFVLLIAGIAVWSAGLMAAAGFVLFEAAAGWCVLNQALGRNTCPIS